ncbi:MAG: phosphoglucosamine mutase [Candidatus Kapaibacteriota bacterium]|jgi:phosphomannomutase
MAFVRSISGIRGTIGDGLTPNIVSNYVSAFTEIIPDGAIVVGRDGRPSGTWIESVVIGTLLAQNRDVFVAGVVPTPTIQILVEVLNAAGGISITASHNPSIWNGLKFICDDGIFLGKYQNQKLFEIVDSLAFKFSEINSTKIEQISAPFEFHYNRILNIPLFRETNILERIKKKKFKVVIDSNNSSGSHIIPDFLEKIGCEVVKIYCDGTGIFMHPPEPNPQNISETAKKVIEYGADIGFVVDPDADRLVLIDENGNSIWEEFTVVLAIQSAGLFLEYLNPKSNKVVVNYSTTQLSDFIARKFGFELIRAPVGEINVVNKMKEFEAIIGGEGSGGVILPNCHYGRDSLVAITLILSLMAKLEKSISEIISEYPNVYMHKLQFKLQSELEPKIEELVNSLGLNLFDVNTEDGYRIESDFGWIHIRKSNTEPIVRVIYETNNLDDQHKIYKLVQQLFTN